MIKSRTHDQADDLSIVKKKREGEAPETVSKLIVLHMCIQYTGQPQGVAPTCRGIPPWIPGFETISPAEPKPPMLNKKYKPLTPCAAIHFDGAQ